MWGGAKCILICVMARRTSKFIEEDFCVKEYAKRIDPACNDTRAGACIFCEGGNCFALSETYRAGKACPFYRPKTFRLDAEPPDTRPNRKKKTA